MQTEGLLEAAVVYGYFPCVSDGDSLIILDEAGDERTRFTFPRQRRDRHLCLSDFFRGKDTGEVDVVGFQVATMGSKISEATAELFAKDAYRDYLELHGLSVQLTEALAEYWHARTRSSGGSAATSRSTTCSRSTSRAAVTPSATRPAPTWRTSGSCSSCSTRSGSGSTLSEEFQLHPEQATSALIVHHPEAKYFNV